MKMVYIIKQEMNNITIDFQNFVYETSDFTIAVGNKNRLTFQKETENNDDFTGNIDPGLGIVQFSWVTSKFEIYKPLRGVFNYKSSNANISYILITAPYNCLLAIVQPYSKFRYNILDTCNSQLSSWDALTYYDSSQNLGIHVISEKQYELASNIEANTIPTWSIISDAPIYKSYKTDFRRKSLDFIQTYYFKDYPRKSKLY